MRAAINERISTDKQIEVTSADRIARCRGCAARVAL